MIFEADTRAGRAFDIALLALILLSVVVMVLDSMPAVDARFNRGFYVLEWGFTLLFTAEYIARLVCVPRPWRYVRSGFGIIDLLSVLPTYLAVLVPGLSVLIDVRVLRLLRIFRILKLTEYVAEFGALGRVLAASRREILVFMSFVLPCRGRHGHADVGRRGPGQRLHQHSGGRVLGHHHYDHGGLRRHRAQDGPGPRDRLGDDDAGMGHAGRADWDRQRRVHRAALEEAAHLPHLSRVPERGPRARCAILQRLRGTAAAMAARRKRHAGHAGRRLTGFLGTPGSSNRRLVVPTIVSTFIVAQSVPF